VERTETSKVCILCMGGLSDSRNCAREKFLSLMLSDTTAVIEVGGVM
jgi:hypothetical protein